MKKNSLKNKIVLFTAIVIAPIIICISVCLIGSRKISGNYSEMLNKLNSVSEIKLLVNNSFEQFNSFFQSSDEQCKGRFQDDCKEAVKKIESLQNESDLNSKYVIRDLLNTVQSYKSQSLKTMKLFQEQGAIDAYYSEYLLTKEMSSYCTSYLTKLTESYIDYNNKIFTQNKSHEKKIYTILGIYSAITIIITIISTLYYSTRILRKIDVLVDASKAVSNGDFKGISEKSTGIIEIDLLYKVFNIMIIDIKNYVSSIEEKLRLENKIKEDEVKILKYENSLKQAQLKVLQSQINPHFLFNTLNCISMTAENENAHNTKKLIKSVSSLLRYSLSKMNRNSTLEDEINIVKEYLFIQRVRFEDRLDFNLYINCDISKYEVPGMTIQPFVENAFIHGIEPKEEGGKIIIKIYEEGEGCTVEIKDTGCGIDEKTLLKIKENNLDKCHTGHTTGLGIKSVVKRLEILYQRDDLFNIKSELGKGTIIFLHIPNKEMNNSVKNLNG